MIVVKTKAELNFALLKRGNDRKIGFVPTMGALHEGHLSLVNQSKNLNLFTVVSIFVNPLQFTNQSDFEKYPNKLEADEQMLRNSGVDLLFIPSNDEIYSHVPILNFELGMLDQIFEAKFRPGHFNGVCNVLKILFELILPDYAFFGLKDYQQVAVVRKLVEILQSNIQIIACETKRDEKGLALSSRNLRLSEVQKIQAAEVSRFLMNLRNNYLENTPVQLIKDGLNDLMHKFEFKLDYFEIAHPETLAPFSRLPAEGNAIALIAYYTGEVRLIDNYIV
jgi:pantoate--beta-alanine ligase